MLISIVVSIYNGKFTLEKCIDSLIRQKNKGYEIILVDDGSKDGSDILCDKYAEKYDFISVIHKENGGLSSARKTGYKYANGEYILFLDCDDYVSSELIEELMNSITQYKSDVIFYDYYLKNGEQKEVERKLNIPENFLTSFEQNQFAINSIADGWDVVKDSYLTGFLWTRCIKKSLLTEEFFISERECYTEDILFNIMLSKKIQKISYISKPLYYYCITENSLTNRYRTGMWKMFSYRQNWITNYVRDNKLVSQARERIERSWWSAIMMSFDNACSTDLKNALNEMREIRNDKNINIGLNGARKHFSLLSKNEKLKCILIYMKCYRLYYLIKKIK